MHRAQSMKEDENHQKEEKTKSNGKKLLKQQSTMNIQQKQMESAKPWSVFKPLKYFGGTSNIQVIVKQQEIGFDQRLTNEFNTVQILDNFSLTHRTRADQEIITNKLSQEKIFFYDRCLTEKENIDRLYLLTLQDVHKDFLTGKNQTIMITGGKNSGKINVAIGSMRDPGIIFLLMKDLFKQYENYSGITLKMSFIEINENKYKDFLIDSGKQFNLKYDPINQVFPFGYSEIIIQDLSTCLRLIKIALMNVQHFEQNFDLSKELVKKATLIIQLKAEITQRQESSEEIIVSQLKIIKLGQDFSSDGLREQDAEKTMNQALINNFQIMNEYVSNTTQKYINQELVTDNNSLTKLLRDSLVGNCQLYIIGCITSLSAHLPDTLQMFRLFNLAQECQTEPKVIKFSVPLLGNIYVGVSQNINETLENSLKPFQVLSEDQKQRLQEILAQYRKAYFMLEKLVLHYKNKEEKVENLNSIYSMLISEQTQIFMKAISSDDLQEYFMGKLQTYSVDRLKAVGFDYYNEINSNLEDLENEEDAIFDTVRNIRNLFSKFRNQTFQQLTNHDVQQISNVFQLFQQLMDVYENFSNLCCFQFHNFHNNLEATFSEMFNYEIRLEEYQHNLNEKGGGKHQQKGSNLDSQVTEKVQENENYFRELNQFRLDTINLSQVNAESMQNLVSYNYIQEEQTPMMSQRTKLNDDSQIIRETQSYQKVDMKLRIEELKKQYLKTDEHVFVNNNKIIVNKQNKFVLDRPNATSFAQSPYPSSTLKQKNNNHIFGGRQSIDEFNFSGTKSSISDIEKQYELDEDLITCVFIKTSKSTTSLPKSHFGQGLSDSSPQNQPLKEKNRVPPILDEFRSNTQFPPIQSNLYNHNHENQFL